MSARRVVITGIGAVTPLGPSLGATLDALAAGQSAVGAATLFDATGFACRHAAEVRNWDPRPSFRVPKALKLTDRPARFAVAAAEMALDHAQWPRDADRMDALGVVIGSSGSDLQMPDIGRALAGDGDARSAVDMAYFGERMLSGLNPLWLLVSLPNMTSAHVAIQLQARGPNSTIMSDWVAGHQAIGEAAEWIRSGEADAVLAGGADSAVQPLAFAACQQAGLFDADADGPGMVPAEGAALFLLEAHESACARRATILGEVRAYSTRAAGGAFHDALARSIEDVVAAVDWPRDEISMCAVAAPGVPAFTGAARRAIESTLGQVPARVAFEPRLGHPLAAAGPLDAALELGAATRSRRFLSSAIGSAGEAVTLAIGIERSA